MMNKLTEQQILEWYVIAGVDVTSGDVPWESVSKESEKISPSLSAKVLSNDKKDVDVRLAMTDLAQANVLACQNARQVCMKVENLVDLRKIVEEFDGCSLKLTANKTVFGYGLDTADILIIGEAPGADEDRCGVPFVGRSGQLLDKMLKTIGVERDHCFVTNVLPWRPPGNRTPTDGEVAVCLPFLKRQIDLVKPKVIVILGGSAANALLGINDPISKLRGKWLEYKTSDGVIVPVLASFHPAYLLRNTGQKAKSWSDFIRIKQKLCEN